MQNLHAQVGVHVHVPGPLQAVAPLLKYLDEKLVLLNASLVKENLGR